MRLAILGSGDGWYCRRLEADAVSRGHDVVQADFTALTAAVGLNRSVLTSVETDLSSFDAVIVRTMPAGSLEQVVYRMDALARLQSAGVFLLNAPKAIECAVDKYLTCARLELAGLPVPETVVCEHADEALDAFDRLDSDVLVKPLFGSEGRGIIRVSDREIALRTFRTLERIQSVLYIQRYVEHDGSDLRLLVLDGVVLGGMRRRSSDGFRANVAQNGRAELHEPTIEERRLALDAAQATGALFAGVDLLYGSDGKCYVIEVNAVPGWRAFQSVTEIDVGVAVVEFLERRCGA